ncbi:protein fem-1 homolog B-like isoform X2 [Corticium candelabrum]|uniref:protein fem-1 homolog B-like isoform X2 n=1 Tax=Corticium candelabrum TaxID=121492 RepID=UPI002E26C54E|nr:protein fem-1 homolog B-like isoform X2 [Corticium candelabrum]
MRGWTVLMKACMNGSKSLVELLLCRGADVNRTGKWGRTAVMEAAYQGYDEIIEFYLQQQLMMNRRMCCDDEESTLSCKKRFVGNAIAAFFWISYDELSSERKMLATYGSTKS